MQLSYHHYQLHPHLHRHLHHYDHYYSNEFRNIIQVDKRSSLNTSVCMCLYCLCLFVCFCMLCREFQSNQNASNARDLPIGIWIWSSISDTRFPKRIFEFFVLFSEHQLLLLLLTLLLNYCCILLLMNVVSLVWLTWSHSQRLTKIYLYGVRERMFVCESEKEGDR